MRCHGAHGPQGVGPRQARGVAAARGSGPGLTAALARRVSPWPTGGVGTKGVPCFSFDSLRRVEQRADAE